MLSLTTDVELFESDYFNGNGHGIQIMLHPWKNFG